MWNSSPYKWVWSFLLILHFTPAASQQKDAFQVLPATFYTVTNDTLDGWLHYYNLYNLQLSITRTDSSGKSLQMYSPKDLNGFRFALHADTIRFASVTNPNDMGRMFLRETFKGRISLYQLLEMDYSSTTLSYLIFYYLWTDTWLSPPITSGNAYRAMLHYFGDCPELELQIKKQELGFEDMETIISQYNKCELTDSYEFIME